MAKTCETCFGVGAHVPSCPEMFWPDGRPRGELVDPLPLPKLITDPEARKNYRFSNPGGVNPIGEMWATIKRWEEEKRGQATQ